MIVEDNSFSALALTSVGLLPQLPGLTTSVSENVNKNANDNIEEIDIDI